MYSIMYIYVMYVVHSSKGRCPPISLTLAIALLVATHVLHMYLCCERARARGDDGHNSLVEKGQKALTFAHTHTNSCACVCIFFLCTYACMCLRRQRRRRCCCSGVSVCKDIGTSQAAYIPLPQPTRRPMRVSLNPTFCAVGLCARVACRN